MAASRRGPSPEEAVSRYRDALIRGAPPDELARLAETLDPATVDTLHWLWETARAARSRPDPLFATRLERELRRGFSPATSEPVPFRAAPSAIGERIDGLPPPLPARPHPQPIRGRWSWRPLAGAAVLMLILSGAFLVSQRPTPEQPQTVFVATGEPRIETLIDATVEGAATGQTAIAIERWRFQPDSTLTIPPIDGPQWLVAETGPLVANVDGSARSLAPGQGLVVRAGQAVALRNSGLSEAAALRGAAAAGFSLEEYDRDLISREVALDTEAHESLPPGTSRIVFDRLTLPPGAAITPEPATGQDWMGVVSGQLGLTLTGDTLPRGWTSGGERELTAADPFPVLVPGTTVTLRSLGDEPVVLLRLRVTPL